MVNELSPPAQIKQFYEQIESNSFDEAVLAYTGIHEASMKMGLGVSDSTKKSLVGIIIDNHLPNINHRLEQEIPHFNLGFDYIRLFELMADAGLYDERVMDTAYKFHQGFACVGSFLEDENQLSDAEHAYANAEDFPLDLAKIYIKHALMTSDSEKMKQQMDNAKKVADMFNISHDKLL